MPRHKPTTRAPQAPPSSNHNNADTRSTSHALWQQLQQVTLLMQAVQSGHSASAALEQFDATQRPGVHALGYTVLRNWGVAQWLLMHMVPRKPPAAVQALLGSALALLSLRCWQTPHNAGANDNASSTPTDGPLIPSNVSPTYTDFTLVNQAVEAAKRHPQMQHQAGLINACLRRFLREHQIWLQRCQQNSPQGQVELLNVPLWWFKQLRSDHPMHAVKIVCAGQQHAPMTLRVNARHMSAADYLHTHLQPAGMNGTLTGKSGIVLHQPCAVQQLPGFAQGWVSVQDAGAQLAAPLLLDALQARTVSKQAPLQLLDACAAPGGKTAHLLELCDHHVTALDIDENRSLRVADTLHRLGLNARLCTADAAMPQTWWDGQAFDGILLDAPCTASGIVRRHPDIAWLRRQEDIASLAAQQQRLLDALWPLLAVGGVMLYCTCSVFKAEGETQVQAFCSRHGNATRLSAPGHLLPTQQSPTHTEKLTEGAVIAAQCPHATLSFDHDGFFYALLVKTGAM